MKPNLYKVVYNTYVGDNYAGGSEDVTAYVNSLSELVKFRNKIVSVIPIKAKFQEGLSSSDIEFLFERLDAEKEEDRKQYEITSLKRKLKELEDD